MNVEEFDTALSDLETRVDRLRALYENWFRGYEKTEPAVARKDVERRVYGLRKELPRNTALRFRYHQLYQRYTTLATYWQRTARQIEEGTHRLQLKRIKRRREDDIARTLAPPRPGENDSTAPAAYELNLDETLDVRSLLDDFDMDQVANALDGIADPSFAAAQRASNDIAAHMRQSVAGARMSVPSAIALGEVAREPSAKPEASARASARFARPAGEGGVGGQVPSMAPANDVAPPSRPAGAPAALEDRSDEPATLPPPRAAAPSARAGEPGTNAVRPAAPSARMSGAPQAGRPSLPAAMGAPQASRPSLPAGTGAPQQAGRPSLPTETRAHAAPPAVPPVPPRSPIAGSMPIPPLPAGASKIPARSGPGTGAFAIPPIPGRPPAPPPGKSTGGAPASTPAAARPGGPVVPAPGAASARPGTIATSSPAARAASAPPAARPGSPAPGLTSNAAPGVRSAAVTPSSARPGGEGGLSDQQMRRIYAEYAAARRKNNEGDVRFEALEGSIRKMLPDLNKRHQGKQIDFEVVLKDGRVGLKPKAT